MGVRRNISHNHILWILLLFCSSGSGKLWNKYSNQASASHLLEQRTKSLYDDISKLNLSSPDVANSIWGNVEVPSSTGDFYTTTPGIPTTSFSPLTTSTESYFSLSKMHPRKPQQTDISTLEPKITFVYTEATTPDPLSSDLDPRFIEQVFRQTIPKNSPAVPSRTDNPPFNPWPFPQQFFDNTRNQWNLIDNPIIINLNDSQPSSPFAMTDRPVQEMPWMSRDDSRNFILPGSTSTQDNNQPTALPLTSDPHSFSQVPMTSIPPWPHRTINPQNMQLGTTNSFRPPNPQGPSRPGPDSSFSLISGPNSPMKGGPSGPFIAGNPPPTPATPHIRQSHITPLVPIPVTTRGGAVDRQDFDPNIDRQNIITSAGPNSFQNQQNDISQIAQDVARARQEGRTREPVVSNESTRRRPLSIGGFRRRTAKPFYAAQRRRFSVTTSTTMSPFIASIQIESHPVTVQQDFVPNTVRLPPVWDGKVSGQNNRPVETVQQFQTTNQGPQRGNFEVSVSGQNVGIQLPPVWDGTTSNGNKQLNPPPAQQQMNIQQPTNSNNIGVTPTPANQNNVEMLIDPMSRQTTPFVCPCLQNPVGQNGPFVTLPTFPMQPQSPPQQMQGPMQQPNRELNIGPQSQNIFAQNQALMSANTRQDFGNLPVPPPFSQNNPMGNIVATNSGLIPRPSFPQSENSNEISTGNNVFNVGQNKLGSASYVSRPPPQEDPYNPVGRATFEYLPAMNSISTNNNGVNNFPGPTNNKIPFNNEIKNFGAGANVNAVITGQGPYPGAESSSIGQSNPNKALQFSNNGNNGPNVGLFAIGPGVTQQSQPTLPRPTMPSAGFETTTPSQWQPFTPHWSTTIAVEGPSQIVSISGLKQLRQDIPESQVPKGPLPIWSYNLSESNKYQQGSELIDPQGTQQTITVDIIHPVRRLISVSANTPICAQAQVNLDLDSSTPPNTILGIILAADPGALSLQWTIERDSSGGVFSINKVTGEFGLIGSLKGINEAKVKVRVGNSLGQFCITLVVVHVRRPFDALNSNGDVESRQIGVVRNSGSWFSQDSFNVTIPCSLPSETLILQAAARHPAGQMIRYMLRGSEEFGLNQTGYVALLRLNLGNPDPFRSFVIIAQDTSGSESTATINVNLDLSTCYGPQFDVAAFIYDVNTDCSGVRPTDEVSQIMALPPSPQSQLSYSLIGTNQFMIDSMSGIISSALPIETTQRLPDFGIVVTDNFGRRDTATVRISVFVNCSTTEKPAVFNDAATTPIEATSNKWKWLDEIRTDLGDFLMRVPCASAKGTVVASINPSTLLKLESNAPDIRLENTAEFVISPPNGTITAQVDLPEVDTLFNFPLIADGSPFGLGRIVGNITVQVVCDSLSTPASVKKGLRLGPTEQVSVPSVEVSTFPFVPLDPWNTQLNLTFPRTNGISR